MASACEPYRELVQRWLRDVRVVGEADWLTAHLRGGPALHAWPLYGANTCGVGRDRDAPRREGAGRLRRWAADPPPGDR